MREEKKNDVERKNYPAMGANNKNEKLYSFVCSAKFCIILTRYRSENKHEESSRESRLDIFEELMGELSKESLLHSKIRRERESREGEQAERYLLLELSPSTP